MHSLFPQTKDLWNDVSCDNMAINVFIQPVQQRGLEHIAKREQFKMPFKTMDIVQLQTHGPMLYHVKLWTDQSFGVFE